MASACDGCVIPWQHWPPGTPRFRTKFSTEVTSRGTQIRYPLIWRRFPLSVSGARDREEERSDEELSPSPSPGPGSAGWTRHDGASAPHPTKTTTPGLEPPMGCACPTYRPRTMGPDLDMAIIWIWRNELETVESGEKALH